MKTITLDLETDIGEIRLLIGDDQRAPDGILPDGANFTDEQITKIRTTEGAHNQRAAAALLELAARRWSRRATRYKLGDEAEERKTAQALSDEAKRLRRVHGDTPDQGRTQRHGSGYAYVYAVPPLPADLQQTEGGPA